MDTFVDEESGDENHVDNSQAPLDDAPEDGPASEQAAKPTGRLPAHEKRQTNFTYTNCSHYSPASCFL